MPALGPSLEDCPPKLEQVTKDPLSSRLRPFGYLRAISSGMLIHSHNFFGHATHILLGSMSLHLTIAQNGKTCNHTHW